MTKTVTDKTDGKKLKRRRKREIFTKEITDMGDFIVRRLAPGVYATIDKPLPTTAH